MHNLRRQSNAVAAIKGKAKKEVGDEPPSFFVMITHETTPTNVILFVSVRVVSWLVLQGHLFTKKLVAPWPVKPFALETALTWYVPSGSLRLLNE